MRKPLIFMILALFPIQASSSDVDRNFYAKLFAEHNTILLPWYGDFRAGMVIDLATFEPVASLDYCLKDGYSASSYVKSFPGNPKWPSGSEDWKAHVKARVMRQDVSIDISRVDVARDIGDEDIFVVIEDLSLPRIEASEAIKPKCASFFTDGYRASTETRPGSATIVLDRVATLQGQYTHSTTLNFSAEADISFTLADILPQIQGIPFLSDILDRFDLSANISGGRIQSNEIRESHNMMDGVNSRSFMAFRPMFYNRSHLDNYKEWIEKAIDQYTVFTADYGSPADNKGLTAALFLDEYPEFSTKKNISMLATFFPGASYINVFENIGTQISPVSKLKDIAPADQLPKSVLEDTALLFEINYLASHHSMFNN